MLMFTLVFGVNRVVLADDFDTSEEDYFDEDDKVNNINELSKEVDSDNSKEIIFVEVFCGVIGIIFVVMALKATSD